MASFPSLALSRDNVKVRFLEPTVSKAINQRFMGLPRGVYVGFKPTTTNGSLVFVLATDARLGFSALKVGAASLAVQIDIFTQDPVQLNFTGHTQFPVYVIARADYTAGTPTQGRILTRATGPNGPQEITICVVDKVGGNLTASATIPGQRQPPLAFSGQAFGYMYGGATDDIVFAQSVTAEVTTARTSLKTSTPSARLADRLALDLAPDYIATQLGLRSTVIVGNTQIVSGGAGTFNASPSFGALTRQTLPALTIDAGGNETTEGAITGSADTIRNVCFLTDETTGARVVDAGANPIYGRLTYSTGALTGTLAFNNAQTIVTGSGTNFTGQLQVGDLILGADGKYYSVTSITNNTQLAVTPAYQGAVAAGFVSAFRRFTVTFYSRGSGAEASATLPATTNVRFFFSAWFRVDHAVFDATSLMKKDGERPAEPIATSAVRGRALLAVSGALAGALYQVNSNQVPLAAVNFHTLNFTAVNAAITDAGGGVANLAVPGNPGAPGPGAIQGPDGPQGDYGPGARALSPFVESATMGPGGSGTMTVTFATDATPPLSGNIIHAVGGISFFDAAGIGFGGSSWRITSIARSGNSATLHWDLSGQGGNAKARFFLGAST